MLIIYGFLDLGGVETFLVRFAKKRHSLNLKTKILLLSHEKKNNIVLLNEVKQYADVYLLNDVLQLPEVIIRYIPYQLLLLAPLNKAVIDHLLADIKFSHVANSFSGLFFIRLLSRSKKRIPLTMGVYHAFEYMWEKNVLPAYERLNRDLFFSLMPKENIFFFNNELVKTYTKFSKKSFVNSNLFPLGVVDDNQIAGEPENTFKFLSIVSVGRLVAFKSYNLWMLDIVYRLKSNGHKVQYAIYGEGPLDKLMKEKIMELDIADCVQLKGPLNYSEFDNTVKNYNLFVGSGTAIVQASGLGIPSIVGIEDYPYPETYDYFSSIPGFSYNEDGLYPKKSAYDLIVDYINMAPQLRINLSFAHINKAKIFSMKSCVENFEQALPKDFSSATIVELNSFIFRAKYTLSYFFMSAKFKLLRKSLYDYTRSK